MYECLGSQFLRTTYEIQSEPDIFDESRLLMTFLTKQVKKYMSPQDQSSWKSFQQTILLYQMQKTTLPGHLQSRCSRSTFVENTVGNLPKVPRAQFLEIDRLVWFITISKFGSIKKPFARFTELYFRLRIFILLVQIQTLS